MADSRPIPVTQKTSGPPDTDSGHETLGNSSSQTSVKLSRILATTWNQQSDPHHSEVQCQAMVQRLKDLGEVRQLAAQLPELRRDVKIGQRIGQFELIELLGSGGMGQVFKARHLRLGKIQAVKLLHDHRLHDSATTARFQQEMHAIGQLQHPNIVAAQHADEADDVPYLVMDYVDGQSLSHLQREYA